MLAELSGQEWVLIISAIGLQLSGLLVAVINGMKSNKISDKIDGRLTEWKADHDAKAKAEQMIAVAEAYNKGKLDQKALVATHDTAVAQGFTQGIAAATNPVAIPPAPIPPPTPPPTTR